jgi:hypothetical protein
LDEMPSIERDDTSQLRDGKRKYFGIWDRLPSPAAIGSGQDIMAETPQRLNSW